MVARFHYDQRVYRRFLDDKLAAPQQQEVNQHVEGCTECQAKLEAILQDNVGWEDIPGLLNRDEKPYGKSVTNGKRTNKSARPEFLDKSDRPNSLGRFGRYEIVEVLGYGGMGVVIKGFDPALNRFSAIKVLAPVLATSASARQRFAREAKSAAAVVHEHVVPIQTVDEENGLPYLVMPVVDGQSLQQRVEQTGPLEVKEVLRIGMQIASGLAAAHAQGLVHRDVKPANVLLENGVERVMLTDFGLARAADDANMTQSGVLAGTPQYMSPEQARGSDVDHRSDLFSLGSVLYFMCTGHSPFRAETTMGVLHRIANDDPRAIRTVHADVPEWLQDIIGRLLAKDRDSRFQTAAEVADVLSQWLAHVQQPDVAAKPETPAPVRGSRSSSGFNGRVRWWLAAAGGFFLVFAGILITLELSKGTLTIECEKDSVPVRIMKDDKVHKRLTVDRGATSTRISAGEYVVEVDGPADGIEVKDGAIVLSRRGAAIAKIIESSSKQDGLFQPGERIRERIRKSSVSYNSPGAYWSYNSPADAPEAEGPPTSGAIKTEATQRNMTIRVVDLENKPIKGATVFRNHVYQPADSEQHKIENATFSTDDEGIAVINLTETTIDLRIWASKDGYVPLHAMWAIQFQADGNQIPGEFTFPMGRGTEIGGIVTDEAGNPISGVKVEVQDRTAKTSPNPKLPGTRPVRAYGLTEGDSAVATDERGRWTLDNVPPDEDLLVAAGNATNASLDLFGEPLEPRPPLLLRLTHPDFKQVDWGHLQISQNVSHESLRAKTAKIVLKRTRNGKSFQDLPRTWTGLVSGSVIAMSIDTPPDGPLTVAIYDDAQTLSLLQASYGEWTKVASQKLPTPNTPRVVVADLDGDHKSEILVCSGRLRVYTVASQGFSLAWSSHESFSDSPAPNVGIADFNADGRKDLAILNYKEREESETQSLYVYTRSLSQPLDFGLTDVATFTDEHGHHSTAGMAIADFSGEGKPQIVVGNDNGFLWLATFDAGKLSIRKQWKVADGGAVGTGLSAGNLDDDPASELLVGTNGGNIFVFDFDDKFEPSVVASAMAGRLAYGVAAGDIDGDQRDEFILTRGKLEYAGMTEKDVVAEVWELRDQELNRVWQQETVDQPRPYVHDLDGDGRVEIVVLSLHGKELQVMQPTRVEKSHESGRPHSEIHN